MSGGPLDGIRVIDLTTVVVGPMVTQVMADYGADVVKVEPPGGDLVRFLAGTSPSGTMSGKFLALNRNKRSICLDMKEASGREVILRLIRDADVLIWNLRPGAMKKLGLDYESVRAINPKIVYCGIVGFGSGGRYAGLPAYDPIVQGVGGIAALNHRATGEPRYVPIVMADKTTGLIATQMLLLALLHRERSGEGSSVEVPMFENIAKFVLEEHLYLHSFEPSLGPMGDPRIFDTSARPIATKDGWLCIAANTNAQAFAFFEAIGRPELKDDARFSTIAARFANVNEYFGLRSAALAQKTTEEWIAVFKRLDVPAMKYNTLEDLFDDPHLREVGLLKRVEHPTEGTVWDIQPPNKLSCGTRTDYSPAPSVGQHTEDILQEAGFSEEQIQSLLRTRVAASGRS